MGHTSPSPPSFHLSILCLLPLAFHPSVCPSPQRPTCLSDSWWMEAMGWSKGDDGEQDREGTESWCQNQRKMYRHSLKVLSKFGLKNASEVLNHECAIRDETSISWCSGILYTLEATETAVASFGVEERSWLLFILYYCILSR